MPRDGMSDLVNLAKIVKQLEKIHESFATIQQSGLDESILIAYLKDQTGLSKKDIRKILRSQDDFYNKLVDKITPQPKGERL